VISTKYPEQMLKPMRQELTTIGFRELKTVAEVDKVLGGKLGSVLVMINSVCGCAAGNARPAVRLAAKHRVIPDQLTTVFAGQDIEPTQRVREFLQGYQPSSPSVALFQNGRPVFVLERHQIERRSPEDIARDLTTAFDTYLS
jgi:putative YphP/YqiW family bacilliredoxin